SEVVVVSTTYGANGAPLGGSRVEWLLAQGGVGEFVTLGDRDETSLFHEARNLPKKVSNTYAIGESSPINVLITRGTASNRDDVALAVGQTWISVTSPVEGTSYVSAFGPDVHNWDQRRATTTISWVDAKWTPPAPAVVKVGEKYILTTTVNRQSDGTPLVGWRVRYEILGQPAGAAASTAEGSQVVEVATNDSGKASVEIAQPKPGPSTVPVNVQLFRATDPANPNSKRALIGAYNTQVTWVESAPAAAPAASIPAASAPSIPVTPSNPIPPATTPAIPPTATTFDVQVTGPEQAAVGSEAKFTINVTNRGTTTAHGLTISDSFEPGLEYPSKSPIGNTLKDIEPGQTLPVILRFTVRQPGRLCHTVTVKSTEGQEVTRTACVTGVAAAQAASFTVNVTGPTTVTAGGTALFTTTVTNNGTQPISRLKLVTTPDPALMAGPAEAEGGRDPEEAKKGRLVWTITNLEAGKSTSFRFSSVTQNPGMGLCVQSDVTDDSGAAKSGKTCIDVLPASGAVNPTSPGTGSTATNLTLDIASTVEPVKVGGETKFQFVVTNAGKTADKDVVLVVQIPPQLRVSQMRTQPGFLRGTPDAQNNTIRFEPIKEFRSGESMTYEVSAIATAAGDTKVNGQVTSQGLAQPVNGTKAASIFAE
ncbi:MAG TPA: hypothetical protein VFE24_15165, partial [Pirellulales bacterium]|nr:hypothetical protein [Pirellulales bacterium]